MGESHMIDKEKISRELAEAVKSMDTSVDTDIDSQQRSSRDELLNEWNEELARNIASELGIELTDAHLQVVHSLREYYREHGKSESGQQLSDMLDKAFASQGGIKYLHRLFPEGPVSQGMRIAGLPVPANTEDAGFGTAR
jgi:TusE/DsrC/DsvC family sulfur relay protein